MFPTLSAPEVLTIHRAPDPAPGLVYAAPHAGRVYPEDMRHARRLIELRRMEDALVDQLVARAPQDGADLLVLHTARTYLDVNRDPSEFDETLFSGALKAQGIRPTRSFRVEQGLGLIPRETEGRLIYDRKLDPAEAARRLNAVFHPYHQALSGLLADKRKAEDFAFLIDWHSMPSSAARASVRQGLRGPDLVIGDRFGASCAPALADHVARWFEGRGFRVARNKPFAGGYVTETYGRPARGVHALQIELNRALYLDELQVEPNGGMERLTGVISAFTQDLALGLRGPLRPYMKGEGGDDPHG